MMKKLMILVLLVTGFALASNAQEEKKKTVIELPQWVKNIKLSGYGMLQYQVQNPDDKTENSFNLRLMRLILDGKIGDFAWRVQMQGSSNAGPGNPTVMLVDLFAEWQKYEFFRVKAGQFKRAFTFENPTHPITQGWYSYATVINSLSGFGDRSGEKASGGRDIGLQIQGDFLKNAAGRNLIHYQIGVYNGEGINQKDRDSRTTRTNGPSALSISTARDGEQQRWIAGLWISLKVTRRMVSMSSALSPSSNRSFTPRHVTTSIVPPRNGLPPRPCTKSA